MSTKILTKTLVHESDRLSFLPSKLGGLAGMMFDNDRYRWAKALINGYSNGDWDYFNLSNDGFYVAPSVEATLTVEVEDNMSSNEMSADAAGITTTLITLSNLSMTLYELGQDTDAVADHFHLLRAYAKQHPEAEKIFEAID